MASVNRVTILGHLGRDPEMKYTPSGSAVCNLRIATTRNWKAKDSGERMEETEWHSVVMYDRQAEIAGEYLKKGRPVYLEGRLKTRQWKDKDGKDRYTTEIVADSMQLLGSADNDSQQGSAPASRAPRPAPAPPKTHGQRLEERRGAASTGFSDMDDEIPF